jgi:hypothetical protein
MSQYYSSPVSERPLPVFFSYFALSERLLSMKADIRTPSEISLPVHPKRTSGLAPEPAVALLSVIRSACGPKRTLTLISLLPGELCCRTALQMISGTG